MDDKTFWSLTYISVLAMRYHPRNGEAPVNASHLIAHMAADKALEDRREKWQSHGEQQSQQAPEYSATS